MAYPPVKTTEVVVQPSGPYSPVPYTDLWPQQRCKPPKPPKPPRYRVGSFGLPTPEPTLLERLLIDAKMAVRRAVEKRIRVPLKRSTTTGGARPAYYEHRRCVHWYNIICSLVRDENHRIKRDFKPEFMSVQGGFKKYTDQAKIYREVRAATHLTISGLFEPVIDTHPRDLHLRNETGDFDKFNASITRGQHLETGVDDAVPLVSLIQDSDCSSTPAKSLTPRQLRRLQQSGQVVPQDPSSVDAAQYRTPVGPRCTPSVNPPQLPSTVAPLLDRAAARAASRAARKATTPNA